MIRTNMLLLLATVAFQKGQDFMPDFRYTLYFRDSQEGETTRTFEGTFTDYATARASADAFLTDFQAVTSAHIYRDMLSEVTDIAGAPANCTVFEQAQISVDLDNGKKAVQNIPAPVSSAFVTGSNSVDIGATVVTNWFANIQTPNWSISDGNYAVDMNTGKRVYKKSGSTNLV